MRESVQALILVPLLALAALAAPQRAPAAQFADGFDGPLDPAWVAAGGSFNASGGVLGEVSGLRHVDAQLHWEGGLTETPDQLAKLRVVTSASHSWGFMFRVGGPDGHHYEVHLPVGATRWRWELADPDFVERVDDCPSDRPIRDGDWLGATVVGSGSEAVVSVWRWDLDPDLGAAPDPEGDWGPPDCTMTADPTVAAAGRGLGIRAYTGDSSAAAHADDWAAGDVPGGECGNGVPEPGEECDDGGPSASCNGDCTLAACGDGLFNPLAEQCESDAQCGALDVCSASCLCEPAPLCGNGIPESGEDCDEFGETASCDADCSAALCGDGVFNAAAEQCEADAHCAAGERCQGCSCVVANGMVVRDEFAGDTLDPGWIVESGSFAVSGGLLVESSGKRNLDARLLWHAPTDTPDQFGKLEIRHAATHTWGFWFRADDPTGHHYEVHLPVGTDEWRWELYDPDFVQRVDQCAGDLPVRDGDWLGATITGAGADTVVAVWRWDSDPDLGAAADPAGSWGPPDCVMQADPPVDVRDGRGFGIRSYTGASAQNASIDSFSGGDLGPVGECGNGVVEVGEACDDAGPSASCNADCTLPACGDGAYNPSAEGCEDDLHCGPGDVCSAGCECVAEPVCGNGFPEVGEDCDEGGQTASCDADCSFPLCGDGELNPSAGEACEVSADCAAGESCSACGCQVASGQLFSDGFHGSELDPAWTPISGAFSVNGGALVESSGQRYVDAQLRWDGGLTDTPDQFAKLRLGNLGTNSWGFMLRVGDGSGHHYEVHLAAGSAEWRWELYDPGFVERAGSCVGDSAPSPGDWIGVAISGSGSDTTVWAWRWDADPDAGGAPDPGGAWGDADCVMQGAPGVDVSDGRGLGLRSYSGASSSGASADDWSAGDLPGSLAPPSPDPIVKILGSDGAGVPNSMLDPDGIAVDSADNVYVAACGLGPQSEGVFKITPGGAISQVLDTHGDGVHPASCPVGIAVDSLDNVYVATFLSDNVFRITPGGAVSEVLDAAGDGVAPLSGPLGVAVDAADRVYVTGHFSDNVFSLPPAGPPQLLLDASGGGTGTPLDAPFGVAVDGAGNLFVAGFGAASDSVFRVSPGGAVSVVLGPSGDGAGNPLAAPHGLAVDAAGRLYVTGNASDNVFEVTPAGVVSVIADADGDGSHGLDNPTSIAVDPLGNVYVAAFGTDNAFRIEPDGSLHQIIDAGGDGWSGYGRPSDFAIAVDSAGNVYSAGIDGDNVFRIAPP